MSSNVPLPTTPRDASHISSSWSLDALAVRYATTFRLAAVLRASLCGVAAWYTFLREVYERYHRWLTIFTNHESLRKHGVD